MDTQPLPRIPIDEEERLKTLTRAQREAYREVMSVDPRYGYEHSNYLRRYDTLDAIVKAGLAEWRSSYPDMFPDAQHYIVPLGWPTYEQLKAEHEAAAEARLTARAQRVLDNANHLNVRDDGQVSSDDVLDLVREIIRELA